MASKKKKLDIPKPPKLSPHKAATPGAKSYFAQDLVKPSPKFFPGHDSSKKRKSR